MKRYLTSPLVWEMQVKTTVRYNFSLLRMAIIKRTKLNKCWWGYTGKGNLNTLLVAMQIWTTVWKVLKNFKIEVPYDSQSSFWACICKKWNQCLEEIAALLFISALFTIGNKIETKCRGWMGKENVRYIHTSVCVCIGMYIYNRDYIYIFNKFYNRKALIKEHSFNYTRWTSARDLIYCHVTRVNNIV